MALLCCERSICDFVDVFSGEQACVVGAAFCESVQPLCLLVLLLVIQFPFYLVCILKALPFPRNRERVLHLVCS